MLCFMILYYIIFCIVHYHMLYCTVTDYTVLIIPRHTANSSLSSTVRQTQTTPAMNPEGMIVCKGVLYMAGGALVGSIADAKRIPR